MKFIEWGFFVYIGGFSVMFNNVLWSIWFEYDLNMWFLLLMKENNLKVIVENVWVGIELKIRKYLILLILLFIL